MAINLTIGYSTYGITNIQLPYMYKKAGDGLVRTGIQEWFAITLYLMQCHFSFFFTGHISVPLSIQLISFLSCAGKMPLSAGRVHRQQMTECRTS